MNTLSDRSVLVLGLGESGLAMAQWCARNGARLRVADTRAAPPGLDALRAVAPSADVVAGSLTDALLATCGAGDIGTHFPPSDPQWRGAASRLFVEHAASIVRAAGGRIANADVTLICEAPKIGPHRAAMIEAMAAMLGIAPHRVSVKATTNEKLGFIGRGEGIAAIATASVVFPGGLE